MGNIASIVEILAHNCKINKNIAYIDKQTCIALRIAGILKHKPIVGIDEHINHGCWFNALKSYTHYFTGDHLKKFPRWFKMLGWSDYYDELQGPYDVPEEYLKYVIDHDDNINPDSEHIIYLEWIASSNRLVKIYRNHPKLFEYEMYIPGKALIILAQTNLDDFSSYHKRELSSDFDVEYDL